MNLGVRGILFGETRDQKKEKRGKDKGLQEPTGLYCRSSELAAIQSCCPLCSPADEPGTTAGCHPVLPSIVLTSRLTWHHSWLSSSPAVHCAHQPMNLASQLVSRSDPRPAMGW
ncbi:hypothetical protein ACOMHN_043729 [Nucella lapillus]